MNKILTPEFRVSFPAVFTPCIFENGKPVYLTSDDPRYKDAKFQIVMLFDKSQDISELKTLAQNVMLEKWPDPETRPSNIYCPFRDGDKEKPNFPGYENTIFIKASMRAVNKKKGTKYKPDIVDQKLNPILDEVDFYAGCYARARVNAFAYAIGQNVGVSFGLGNIQKLRDGEPLDGRVRGKDDFSPIEENVAVPASGPEHQHEDMWQ